jgi:hypothetical protein
MTRPVLVAMILFISACATEKARLARGSISGGRWQGYVLRDGLQVPVEVDLAETSGDWTGNLHIGGSSVPLEHIRLTPLGIHFELPGDGAFDGTVAGNLIAGSVSSGPTPGAFALMREAEQNDLNPDRR